MPTSVARLAGKITDSLDDYDNIAPADKAAARADFANKLATAIIDEIKAATITYTSGLTAASNPVVGVFNNTIT